MGLPKFFLAALLLLGAHSATGSTLQTPEDQADPSVVAGEIRHEKQPESSRPPTVIESGEVASTDLSQAVLVGAVRVEGAIALTSAAFAPAIDPYLGRELTSQELQALASDIANVARRRGYGLATAWIPEQRIANGILRIIIDEGRIDGVRVTGNGSTAVNRALSGLVTGRPVKTAQLERALLVAEDMAGVRVGRARLDRSGKRNILLVDAHRDRIEVRALVDNWGSKTVGRVRTQLSVDFNGLVTGDDRLSVNGMVTPAQPRELALVRLTYGKLIGTTGTEVTFNGYYAATHPGDVLKSSDIDGRSAFAQIGIGHPLLRSRSTSLWAYAQLSLLDTTQQRADVTFRDDRIVSMEATLYGTTGGRHGRVRARISYTRGLDLLGSSGGPHPLASRPDGSALFSKVDAWAAYDARLGAGFSLALQAEGQIASRPLLSSEEMGLGGRYFLRGYDFREFSGDKGIAGSAELRLDLKHLPKPINSAQLYVYADAGAVGNYQGGSGSGSLASAGGGVRLRIADRFDAGLEIGVPLRDGFDPAASRNPRLSFTLGASF